MPKPRIRCSQLGRLLACPGSRILEAIVEAREGDDGVEGSFGHHLVASRCVRELGASAPPGGLPWPADVPAGYVMPSYSAWVIEWCMRIVRANVPPTWCLEVENALEWEFDRFILTGHEDVAATSPEGREGEDDDWKMGKIPVTRAEFNKQVLGYMALRKLNYTDLDRLRFTVGQPWNDEDAGFERQSSVEMEGQALENNIWSLESDINDALSDADLLETGALQCRYCIGPSCPAVRAHAKDMRMRLTPELLAQVRKTPDSGPLVDLVADGRALRGPLADAEEMLKKRLERSPVLTSESGAEARMKVEGAGFEVVDPIGFLKELDEIFTTEQLAPALSYPTGRIKDALANVMDIPKTGDAEMTAETVFAARFAPFIEPKEKRSIILS